MFSPKLRALAALALAAAATWLVSSVAQAGGDGFTPAFNGKDMKNFKYVIAVTKTIEVDGKKKNVTEMVKGDDPTTAPTKTWKVDNGVIVCTGKPNGYFYVAESLKNYVVKFDWKYARPADLKDDEKFGGNSGYLAHIT